MPFYSIWKGMHLWTDSSSVRKTKECKAGGIRAQPPPVGGRHPGTQDRKQQGNPFRCWRNLNACHYRGDYTSQSATGIM